MRCPAVILASAPNQLALFRAMAPSNALRGPGGLNRVRKLRVVSFKRPISAASVVVPTGPRERAARTS